jgi:hypothetical protein
VPSCHCVAHGFVRKRSVLEGPPFLRRQAAGPQSPAGCRAADHATGGDSNLDQDQPKSGAAGARRRHAGDALRHPAVRLTDDQGKQYNLLAAEGTAPTTDIVTVVSHRMPQFADSNLLAPMDPDRLKNFKTINSAYQDAPWLEIDGKRYAVPILAGFEGMAYNTD